MAKGGPRPGAGRPKGTTGIKQRATKQREAAQRLVLRRAMARNVLSAERVLEELRRVAFSDLSAFVDERGRLKPLQDIPLEARAALAAVKLTRRNLTAGDGETDDVIEVKLWDKLKALNDLAKHFGLLVERVEHTGGIDITWKDVE